MIFLLSLQNMTLHLTLYNDAKLKYGPDRNTESQRYQKLTCDITPLLKLLYNNNLHIHKAMSTISTIHNTNYQNTNYIQIITNQEKLPTYQHE